MNLSAPLLSEAVEEALLEMEGWPWRETVGVTLRRLLAVALCLWLSVGLPGGKRWFFIHALKH